ncbi:uncharacterized protein TNCV_1410411 [Trichonephila clavipes]|nr:uncharacterized protein TNCV_1410411 [Trichonephila clavipes]
MFSDESRFIVASDSGHQLLWRERGTPTRGLLATDLVILNHGQVTWTTPELEPPLLTTTPHQREDVSALDRFNVHRCPTRRFSLLVEWLRQQTKLLHLSEANPQVYVETPLHPEKLTVWCALWAGGILLQKR